MGQGSARQYVYDVLGRQTTIPAIDTPATATDATAGDITLGYYDDDLPRSVSQTVAYAITPDEIQIVGPDGSQMSAMTSGYIDLGGWAEYKLGVIATRVGAVPVGYVHYSWSTMWKMKNAADRYGSASAAVVSVACSKLPNLALRAACVALVQSYNIFTKDKINAAINAVKCLAVRQAYSALIHRFGWSGERGGEGEVPLEQGRC